MKKHISEVEICDDTKPNHRFGSPCKNYYKDDFCFLCGYFMEGSRLYMEIHGSNGALNRVKDIDSAQPYACMECVEQFEVRPKIRPFTVFKLTNFLRYLN